MEWRQSVHPYYEVSEDGRLRSLVSRSNRLAGTILKGCAKKGGYVEYRLQEPGVGARGAKCKSYFAHRLVLIAFEGPPPTGKEQCAHWDGDATNNHISNLRWVSAAENTEDKIRHGRHRKGHRKLTEDMVLDIRAMRAKGLRYVDIQDKYKVSKGNLSAVINRTTWGYI